MSRIAPTSEKIMAVAGVFTALAGELEDRLELTDPRVQVGLLMASVDIAMHTDTRDLGILGGPPRFDPPGLLRRDNLDGTTGVVVTDLANGDHFAYPENPNVDAMPCDDCGALAGEPHDLGVEH